MNNKEKFRFRALFKKMPPQSCFCDGGNLFFGKRSDKPCLRKLCQKACLVQTQYAAFAAANPARLPTSKRPAFIFFAQTALARQSNDRASDSLSSRPKRRVLSNASKTDGLNIYRPAAIKSDGGLDCGFSVISFRSSSPSSRAEVFNTP